MKEDFIKELHKKIDDHMKEYGFTESDFYVGSAGQMKGYIMGLKEALRLAEALNESDTSQVEYDGNERIKSNRRRSSRS